MLGSRPDAQAIVPGLGPRFDQRLYRQDVRAPYTLVPTEPRVDRAAQVNIWNMPVILFNETMSPPMTAQPQTQRIISSYAFLPVNPGQQATFGST